jgi:uncharacterized membrane protein YoaK (UPF0700 family)
MADVHPISFIHGRNHIYSFAFMKVRAEDGERSTSGEAPWRNRAFFARRWSLQVEEELVSLESSKPALPQWAVANVLALNVATGIVEAVSFAHFGGLFAAFVTGTIVLAGLHLGIGGFATMLPYGVAFLGFVCGAFLGGSLIRGEKSRTTIYTRTLVVEALVLALAALAAIVPSQLNEPIAQLVPLGLLALGMSVQFSATRYLDVPFLAFAAATGQVHGIAQDLLARRGVPRLLSRRLLALVTLVVGAAIGALVALWSVSAAIAIAVLIVLASALWARASGRGSAA